MRPPKPQLGKRRWVTGKAMDRKVRALQDLRMNDDYGRTHSFTIFRLGMEECAKCGKTRAEHR